MGSAWGVALGFAVVAGATLGIVAVIPVVLILALMQAIGNRWTWWLLALGIAATILGAARSASVPSGSLPAEAIGSQLAAGEIVSMSRGGVGGRSVLVVVDRIGPARDATDVEPFVVWVSLAGEHHVSRGDLVEMLWSIDSLSEVAPGYASYLRAQGAVATAHAWKIDVVTPGPAFFGYVEDLRSRVTEGLMSVLPGDRGALAAGIVTGDDSGLSDEAATAFRQTGTSHITAVSGSNVAMVVSLWAAFVPSARGRRFLAVQIGIIASVWVYAFLTGMEPPVARAATMATLMLLGAHVGRRPDPMTLLALTSAAMVLWNPRNVELIAFWLSVVATAAIISRLPVGTVSDAGANAIGIGQGVLLAQLATIPLVLVTFGTWSLVSVVTNVVLAPLMLLAFPLCFLLGGLVLMSTWLASLVAWIPSLFLGFSLQVVDDFAALVPSIELDQPGLPGSLMVVVPCVLGTLLLTRDGRRWLDDVEEAWRRRPVMVSMLGAGSLAGLVSALVIALIP